MAYANWARVTPSSGSGNQTTSWTAEQNTGRNQRQTTAYYQAGSISRTATIIQAGSPLYINVTNPSGTQDGNGGGSSQYSTTNSGGTLTIQGKTNAKSLTYSAIGISGVDDVLALTLPSSYTANSSVTQNGANISGDPGKANEFQFSISLTIPQNQTSGTLGCGIMIIGNDENNSVVTWQVNIIQAAGAAYLWVEKENQTSVTVNLPYTGTPAQTVDVISNTSWTVV